MEAPGKNVPMPNVRFGSATVMHVKNVNFNYIYS